MNRRSAPPPGGARRTGAAAKGSAYDLYLARALKHVRDERESVLFQVIHRLIFCRSRRLNSSSAP